MHIRFHTKPELKCTSIHRYLDSKFEKAMLNAPGLAFVSNVSLSTLGVFEYFHVLQGSFRFSFLGFRHERIVTVRKIYTECNAGFRRCDGLVIYLIQLSLAIFTLTMN
jgi:hypothetical protein